MKQIATPVSEGIEYRCTDDADVVSWSNLKLTGGKDALTRVSGVLLIWLSVVLFAVDWALFGSLPGTLAVALVTIAFAVLLLPLHHLVRCLGHEGIRVTNEDVEFQFAGLCWPRRVKITRPELDRFALVDRVTAREGRCRRLLSLVFPFWSRQSSVILPGERMEDDQQKELYDLLCSILAKRGWHSTIDLHVDGKYDSIYGCLRVLADKKRANYTYTFVKGRFVSNV